jgi:hypothetical protein
VSSSERRVFLVFHLVLGLTLMWGSVHTVLHLGPTDLPARVIGSVEVAGAVAFLLPRTLSLGAVLLLLTLVAALLVVYAAGVLLVTAHGSAYRRAPGVASAANPRVQPTVGKCHGFAGAASLEDAAERNLVRARARSPAAAARVVRRTRRAADCGGSSNPPTNGCSEYEARSSDQEIAVERAERQSSLGRVVSQRGDRGTKDHTGRGPDSASEERPAPAIRGGQGDWSNSWLAGGIGWRRLPGLEAQGCRGGEGPLALSVSRARNDEN